MRTELNSMASGDMILQLNYDMCKCREENQGLVAIIIDNKISIQSPQLKLPKKDLHCLDELQ